MHGGAIDVNDTSIKSPEIGVTGWHCHVNELY